VFVGGEPPWLVMLLGPALLPKQSSPARQALHLVVVWTALLPYTPRLPRSRGPLHSRHAAQCEVHHHQALLLLSAATKLHQAKAPAYRDNQINRKHAQMHTTHLPTPPVDRVVVGGEPPWLVVVCVVPPTLPELKEDAPGPDV
jgi:hypothetical protein